MIIVDVSAAIALVAPSQATKATDAFARNVTDALSTPWIFAYELRNSLLRLTRTRRLAESQLQPALDAVEALIGQSAPPLDADGQARVFRLARSEGLTFYDACYVDLAKEAAAGLATRDGAQLAAAVRCGVTAFDLR